MNRFFMYLNRMPWAKPMAILVILNDIVFIWVSLFSGKPIDSNLRDIIIGITCIVGGGNYAKSYLEHKVDRINRGGSLNE